MASSLNNRLLDALPLSEQAALQSRLKPVSLPLNTVVYEADAKPRYAFFMTSGIASIVTSMVSGDAVEVGLIGHEGVSASIHLLGKQQGSSRCFMQVAGTALRMEFPAFQQKFAQLPGLHERVLQYVQYDNLVLSQLSACNRVHEVEDRLARWLLMVSDRLGKSELHLTQEFLAQMLGTRRSTVTVTAGALQRSGLIEYRRGEVKILDRESLENVACECYAFTRKVLRNLYAGNGHGAH